MPEPSKCVLKPPNIIYKGDNANPNPNTMEYETSTNNETNRNK